MVRNHKQGMVDALAAGCASTSRLHGSPPASSHAHRACYFSGALLTGTCETMAGEQLPSSLAQRLLLLPQTVRDNPLALLRLAPILIVAAALPAMLAPLLRGPPQVPEPRCDVLAMCLSGSGSSHLARVHARLPPPRGPFEPGDSGAPDAADVADVGCLPPGVSNMARSTKKKSKKAAS